MAGIRRARLDEVPHLVAMGCRFLAQTTYQGVIAENPAQMTTLATQLVTSGDAATVLVSEDAAGAVVGMIGLVCAPHFLSGELSAGEVFWWVEPEARGAGVRLLRAAETWAQARGAVRLQMIAPDNRLERLYTRLGYVPVERTYQRRFDGNPLAQIEVWDDVLPDPAGYRRLALAQPFGDVTVGAATFPGIAPAPDTQLLDWLTGQCGDCGAVTTFLRLSPAGQVEPNFVHTDCDMGAWTAIYYVTDDPPVGDGTTFWRDRQGLRVASTTTDPQEAETWRDLRRWEPWHTVEAKANRLVRFPAAFYHSRAIFESYGTTPEEARLIQVLFGGSYVRRH